MRMIHLSQTIRSAIVASMIAIGVAGCLSPQAIGTYLPNFFAMSDEKRASEIKSLGTMEGSVADAFWGGLLGNSVIYLPESYRKDLTKNEDTFLKFVVGAFLARNNIPYEALVIAMQDKGKEVPISRETFNYYKGFGGAWLDDIQRRNAGIAQRYELFKKRVGSDAAGMLLFKPDLLRKLLRDDAAFDKFLRDDAYARKWLEGAVDQGHINIATPDSLQDIIRNPGQLLRPVTIGILPALGS